MAVCGARHHLIVQRYGWVGADCFGAHNALRRAHMRQQQFTGYIANGIHAWYAGAHARIHLYEATLQLHTQRL